MKIMKTFNLLQKYLEYNPPYDDPNYTDLTLNDYQLNGSIIKITYSYNPNSDFIKDYISYDNKMEIELLDYITWVYNESHNI